MRYFILTLIIICILPLRAQKETELRLTTSDGKTLYGTLLLPKKKNYTDLVLIISGSGPTDRNGNNPLMKNNSLKMLAQALAKHKIATFRFDKRGIAKSKNAAVNESELRFDTYVNDVIEWFKFLQKTTAAKRIFIAGHSEGSLVGMIAANRLLQQDIPVAGFISLSGAGKPAGELLKEQLRANIPDSVLLQKSMEYIQRLDSGKTIADPEKSLYAIFRPSVQPYLISWFRYRPQEEIKKLSIPVLIIQGNADLQVPVSDAKLLAAANPQAQLVIIDKMNHLLKPVSSVEENQASYRNPDLKISKEAVTEIIEFISPK